MPNEPEEPTPPNGEPSETVTSPAGAVPPNMPTLRTPRHGQGKILTGGMPGNKGGTGHPAKVREKLVLIGDQTCDELLARLADEKLRAKMSVDALRLVLGEVLPYLLARRFEHSGPDGGAIQFDLEAARQELVEKIQRRLGVVREIVLPNRAAPEPEPPTSRGSTHAAL